MSKKDSFDDVLDILSVLQEIDLALAPIIPTDKMCQQGAEVAGITPDLAKKIYVTMLLSAQDLQTDPTCTRH